MDRPPFYHNPSESNRRTSQGSSSSLPPLHAEKGPPHPLEESMSRPLPPIRANDLLPLIDRQRFVPSPSDYEELLHSAPHHRILWDMPRHGAAPNVPAGLASSTSYHGRIPLSPAPPHSAHHSSDHLPHIRASHHAPPPTIMAVEGPDPAVRPHPDSDAIYNMVHVKRPRVSLACLACRNRKSRCDGTRPTCKTCAHMKIECKWPEIDFRRSKSGDTSKQKRKSFGGGSSGSGSGPPKSPDHLQNRSHHMEALDPYGDSASDRKSQPFDPASSTSSASALSLSALSNPAPNPPLQNRLHTSRRSFPPNSFDHEPTRAPIAEREFCSRSPSERYLLPQLKTNDDPGAFPPRPNFLKTPPSETKSPPFAGAPRRPFPDRSQLESNDTRRHSSRRAQEEKTADQRFIDGGKQCRDNAASIIGISRRDVFQLRFGSSCSRDAIFADTFCINGQRQRLDQVLTADLPSLGLSKSSYTLESIDVLAGITGIIEIFDQESREATEKQPLSARLHIFRLCPPIHSRPTVEQVTISLNTLDRSKSQLLKSLAKDQNVSAPVPIHQLASIMEQVMANANLASKGTKNDSASDGFSFETGGNTTLAVFDGQYPSRAFFDKCLENCSQLMDDVLFFIDSRKTKAKFLQKTLSPMLANALCGISIKLAIHRGVDSFSADQVAHQQMFLDKARSMIGASLLQPRVEDIAALVTLAFSDFTSFEFNSASALISLAMRLCIDLGLHRKGPEQTSDDTNCDACSHSILFWTVYGWDRAMALHLGGPISISDRNIDVPSLPLTINGEPSVLAYLVQHLGYAGQIADTLFSTLLKPSPSLSEKQMWDSELSSLENELVARYESLPRCLKFNASNFKRAIEQGQVNLFITLHLAHHSSIILCHIMSGCFQSEQDAFDVAMSSAREVAQVAILVEGLDENTIFCFPLGSYAFFLAGAVFLAEFENLNQGDQSHSDVAESLRINPNSPTLKVENATTLTRSILSRCLDFLEKRSKYSPEAGFLFRILHERASNPNISSSVVAGLVKQLKAVQIFTKKSSSKHSDDVGNSETDLLSTENKIQVERITDLEQLSYLFPNLFPH